MRVLAAGFYVGLNVWQGIALLSPAFERNLIITYPCARPFITESSLGSMKRFQTSYNSYLHSTDISVMQYVGSLV